MSGVWLAERLGRRMAPHNPPIIVYQGSKKEFFIFRWLRVKLMFNHRSMNAGSHFYDFFLNDRTLNSVNNSNNYSRS